MDRELTPKLFRGVHKKDSRNFFYGRLATLVLNSRCQKDSATTKARHPSLICPQLNCRLSTVNRERVDILTSAGSNVLWSPRTATGRFRLIHVSVYRERDDVRLAFVLSGSR